MKTTEYFRDNVIVKRPYIELAWCARVIASPLREEHQPLDGRWRMWGYIAAVERYLRVVTLEDRETVHNAFFDRRFKP